MSGRRSKKSKFYSRSYSKPLFDPQRLLYFSTTNQRLGKVIRPKSSAVRNIPKITKENVQEILDDLNETKSFRIEKDKFNGMPISYFEQIDKHETVDINPIYNNHEALCCISLPLTYVYDQDQKEMFSKNYQPYTPSLLYPVHIYNQFYFDITHKVTGDVLYQNYYIIPKSEYSYMLGLPGDDFIHELEEYRLYSFSVNLDDVEQSYIDILNNSAFISTWITYDDQDEVWHFQFEFPYAANSRVDGSSLIFPATALNFSTDNMNGTVYGLMLDYILQQRAKYSIWRSPPPEETHAHISLVKEFNFTEPHYDYISTHSDEELYLFSYCYIDRQNAEENKIPFDYTLQIEGFEINPIISAQ